MLLVVLVKMSLNVKSCFVPNCPNNTETAPHKLFLMVPLDERRKRWCNAVQVKFSYKKYMYCCEDHFNLQEDLTNYMFYKIAGVQMRVKKHVVPHLNLNWTHADKMTVSGSQITEADKKRREEFLMSLKENKSNINNSSKEKLKTFNKNPAKTKTLERKQIAISGTTSTNIQTPITLNLLIILTPLPRNNSILSKAEDIQDKMDINNQINRRNNLVFNVNDIDSYRLRFGKLHHSRCQFCNYVSRSVFFMNNHVPYHKNKILLHFQCDATLESFTCTTCTFTTDLLLHFRQHFHSHFNSKKKKRKFQVKLYRCRNCLFETYSIIFFIRHQQSCYVIYKNSKVKRMFCSEL